MAATVPRVVVMGVAGSGKSTVGVALAARLGVDFADADDFHSAHNIAAMTAGVPLTDEDRAPWLAAIAQWLADRAATGGVVACSALRRRYRDALREGAPDALLLHLAGRSEVIAQRVEGRAEHFMPTSLVASQLEALEPPGPDERAVEVDASLPVDQIVAKAVDAIG